MLEQAVPVMQSIQKAFVAFKNYKPPERPASTTISAAAAEASYENVAKRPSMDASALQRRDSVASGAWSASNAPVLTRRQPRGRRRAM